MEPPSFTEAVRQELASLPIGRPLAASRELSALCRFAGSLTRPGGHDDVQLAVTSTSGAVVRRAFTLLQHRYGVRPELAVRAPGGVRRRASYQLRVADAGVVARDLGLLDEAGRPVLRLPDDLEAGPATAYLRGAVLAAATFSSPGRPSHLEFSCGSAGVAAGLAELLRRRLGAVASVPSEDRVRVVIKSGATIGELLILVGAPAACVRWDDRRLRHQLRNDANRLANADSANVDRTIRAASRQVAGVEEVLGRVGWKALDDELREVALARLANPEASLQELGELLDPPVGKSTVHRRLARLLEFPEAAGPKG